MDGDPAEVRRYFRPTCEQVQQLLRDSESVEKALFPHPTRNPIEQLDLRPRRAAGRCGAPRWCSTLAQGACMACEDAVTLGLALRREEGDWPRALALYERSRVARTARVVLSAREMGHIYHAKGVERLVRNSM